MAIALVNRELGEEGSLANYKVDVVNFKGDGAYTTAQGGSPNVAQALGVRKGNLLALIPISHGGLSWDYDPGTDRLKLYGQPAVAAAGASPEVASGNYSAITFRALMIYS